MNEWLTESAATIDQQAVALASERQQQLTKPAGSLGRLESLAIQFAGWQGRAMPKLESTIVRVFAADHGVCAQNISAFPQTVTIQMIANFLSGGAAISVLSKRLLQWLSVDFAVVNMGCVTPLSQALLNSEQLINCQLATGTADFTEQAAISESLLASALLHGRQQIQQQSGGLFIGGEMGIGNTTSATAILAALLDAPVADIAGPGTGLDGAGVRRKIAVIEKALSLHQCSKDDPLEILRCVGGLEIAALVGSYIAAAQAGIPVVVDGFICTSAAVVATRINPSVKEWMIFSHRSAEPGHKLALCALNASPLLDLGMRLGEGSGAAIALPIIESALTLHSSMATFAEAGVSDGQ